MTEVMIASFSSERRTFSPKPTPALSVQGGLVTLEIYFLETYDHGAITSTITGGKPATRSGAGCHPVNRLVLAPGQSDVLYVSCVKIVFLPPILDDKIRFLKNVYSCQKVIC